MPSFTHYVVVLMILCQYTDEVWSSNLHKQKYYGFAKHASSEEDLNNGFKSSNTPYYNSREAHGDSLDIVDARNLTHHYFTNSAEDSIEETPGSVSTILEGYLNKSEVNKYPYPLRIGSHESYEFSKYDPDTVKINLDISDYLEALPYKKVSVNKYIEPHNIRKNYGQAQSGVIFAEHSYFVPLSNSHLPKVDSIESKEDLTDNINTKSVYEHNFSTESKELSSQEIVGIYSIDTDSVKYVLDVDSLESKQDLTYNVNTKSVYEQNFSTESKEVSPPKIFGIYSSDTDSVKYVELGSAESADTVKINLDISDYLEALSDKKLSVNKYIEPHNIRKKYGQAQSDVIFAEHSYLVPLSNTYLPNVDSIESKEDLTDNINTKSVYEHNFSTESKELSSQEIVGIYSSDTDSMKYVLDVNSLESKEDLTDNINTKSVYEQNFSTESKEVFSHEIVGIYSSDTDSVKYVLDVDSLESKQDLTDNVNTKSVYEQNFSTESKEVSSPEIFGIYSSDTDSVKYVELGSAESSETTESWALLTHGQTRIRPGVPQDFPSTEVSLPLCSGSKKGNNQNQCKKEQNLCRSTGDCRIARIWGTCCNSPGCGTYCKPNKSKCPHPNSFAEICNIKSDEYSDKVCSSLKDDCSIGTSCCQTPCGNRCV